MTTANVAVPNRAIPGQLEQILNVDSLIQRFQRLDVTHTKETQWSKAFGTGALVLGILAGVAYNQAYKYAAATAAVGALYALTQLRKTVSVPTPDYKRQCDEIHALFKGVAQELRTTWQVASNLIAGVNNERSYRSVDEADRETGALVNTYLRGTWLTSNDPFGKAQLQEKPWRDQFKTLYPLADRLSRLVLGQVQGLHPVVREELAKVHAESVRLVFGTSPAVPNTPYVENKSVGKDADAKIVSQPWPAPALKA